MPTKLADTVFTFWLAFCVAGTVVPYFAGRLLIAPALLLGMILVTYHLDRRYPGMSWAKAIRTFRETHVWNPMWVFVCGVLWFSGLRAIDDGAIGGAFVVMLSVYGLVSVAASPPVQLPQEGLSPFEGS